MVVPKCQSVCAIFFLAIIGCCGVFFLDTCLVTLDVPSPSYRPLVSMNSWINHFQVRALYSICIPQDPSPLILTHSSMGIIVRFCLLGSDRAEQCFSMPQIASMQFIQIWDTYVLNMRIVYSKIQLVVSFVYCFK